MKKLIALTALILFIGWAVGFNYFMQHPNMQQMLVLRDHIVNLRNYRWGADKAEPTEIEQPFEVYEPIPVQQTAVNKPVARHREMHDAGPLRNCAALPARAVTPISAAPIYRWTNASGSASFGDRAPTGMNATLYTSQLSPQQEYFLLDIKVIGSRQLPFLKSQLQIDATGIYQVLKGLVGEDRLRQVELNVRVFEHQDAYRVYAQNTVGARSADADGFYTTKGNEAVTFQHATDAQTLAVLRHEAVHVIVAGMLGVKTPLWLNEGLAVYFENLKLAGQYGNVMANERYLALARQAINKGYPRRFTDLLTADADSWHDNNEAANYALGWSLVYFLMDSSQGRRALAALLQEKADNYCSHVDQRAWLARSYPGGIASLQRDFYRWVTSSGIKASHRY